MSSFASSLESGLAVASRKVRLRRGGSSCSSFAGSAHRRSRLGCEPQGSVAFAAVAAGEIWGIWGLEWPRYIFLVFCDWFPWEPMARSRLGLRTGFCSWTKILRDGPSGRARLRWLLFCSHRSFSFTLLNF